jgi:hypothetical protein
VRELAFDGAKPQALECLLHEFLEANARFVDNFPGRRPFRRRQRSDAAADLGHLAAAAQERDAHGFDGLFVGGVVEGGA